LAAAADQITSVKVPQSVRENGIVGGDSMTVTVYFDVPTPAATTVTLKTFKRRWPVSRPRSSYPQHHGDLHRYHEPGSGPGDGLHRRQRFEESRRRDRSAIYCGTLSRNGFGEVVPLSVDL
jgi:hypothetical protein